MRSLLAALGVLCLAACSSLNAEPHHPVSIAGYWLLDPAHSDDFDLKVTQWLTTQQLKRQKALKARGMSQMPSDTDQGGLGYYGLVPAEPADKIRARFNESLRPATHLHIEQSEGDVSIDADGEPARSYTPLQQVSRIDTSGTAKINSGWLKSGFDVEADYSGGEERVYRYEIDNKTGQLLVTLFVRDETAGKWQVKSRYRRQGGPPDAH